MRFDLLLLDSMLTGLPSELAGSEPFRQCDTRLAASTAERDKVDILLAGADDYVTKPFNMPELMACIRVVLRRRAVSNVVGYSLIDLVIDFDNRRVMVGDRENGSIPQGVQRKAKQLLPGPTRRSAISNCCKPYGGLIMGKQGTMGLRAASAGYVLKIELTLNRLKFAHFSL